MNMPDEFRTSDFCLAASLSCLGYSLDSLDLSNRQRAEFCFNRTEGLDEAIQAFWNRELRIEPMTYAVNAKLLKSRLYNTLNK